MALANELAELVGRRVLDPLEILFGSAEQVDPLRDRLRIEAEVWAAQLLGPDGDLAVRTSARLIAAIFPGDGPFDPSDEWWSTPFGRAVARRAGHPGLDAVSFATAGAMLGITRQGVHDLVRRDLAGLPPHFRVAELEGSHDMLAERPGDVAALIAGFLGGGQAV
ncbi:hypothetical protein GCM10009560_46330 [Nonomuraea longicatena]|uniref:Uncharacterized protein n=1 Tax=Nonomuraea longicatena TaxID=83682 RepID=A0ABP4AN73_9ACTN